MSKESKPAIADALNGAPLSRAYLEDQIQKSRDAIAFASPRADMTFAKAILAYAQAKLDSMVNA